MLAKFEPFLRRFSVNRLIWGVKGLQAWKSQDEKKLRASWASDSVAPWPFFDIGAILGIRLKNRLFVQNLFEFLYIKNVGQPCQSLGCLLLVAVLAELWQGWLTFLRTKKGSNFATHCSAPSKTKLRIHFFDHVSSYLLRIRQVPIVNCTMYNVLHQYK